MPLNFNLKTVIIVSIIGACLIFTLAGFALATLLKHHQSVITQETENNETTSLRVTEEPIQNSIFSPQNISVKTGVNNFLIQPKAEYKISAKVVGKKGYSHGFESELSPVDLALVWGDLAKYENRDFVSYSQSNRWYYFRYGGNSPFSQTYIYHHSANTHIIPANSTIKQSIDRVGVTEKIYLEGYLVNVDGTYNGKTVWWRSSLSRSDRGNGSCELFYVTKAIVDGKSYS